MRLPVVDKRQPMNFSGDFQRGQQQYCGTIAGLLLPAILLLGACSGNKEFSPDQKTRPKMVLDLHQLTDHPKLGQDDIIPIMVDVAAQRGLVFQYHSDDDSGNMYLPEVMGAGVSCLDFDLDGWCDIYLPNGTTLQKDAPDSRFQDALFRNVAGQFVDVTAVSGILELEYSHGCAIGDYNRDGFEDLLIANFGVSKLFVNQGDGTFLEVKCHALSASDSWWTSPLFVDIDNDGFEDIVLASYAKWYFDDVAGAYDHGVGYPGPERFDSSPILALLSDGTGSFSDQTENFGFDKKGKAMGIAAVDLDHDLKNEIYIANDSMSNFLFTRSRSLRFDQKLANASRVASAQAIDPQTAEHQWLEVAEWAGIACGSTGLNEASMCVTLADFDQNSWTDIFVSNYYLRKNTLYSNKGDLNFRDISAATRMDSIGMHFVSFGAIALDYDLEGQWDLIIANGHVIGPSSPIYRLPCQLVRNLDGTFIDISEHAGEFFKVQSLGRGVASLDFDNDGDTDILVTHNDRNVALLDNRTPRKHRLIAFEIMDPKHGMLAGGRIELDFGNRKTCIPIVAGGSYLCESQKKWTIGLGHEDIVPKIEVYWNDGQVDKWQDIQANQLTRLSPGRKTSLALPGATGQ